MLYLRFIRIPSTYMVLFAFSILLHLNYIQNFDRRLLGANNVVTSFDLKVINLKMPRLLAGWKFNHDFVIKESPIIVIVNWPYTSLKSCLLPGPKYSLFLNVMIYFLAILIVGGFSDLLRVEHVLLSPEAILLWKVTFIKNSLSNGKPQEK